MSTDEIVTFGVRSFTTEPGFIKIYKNGNKCFIKCKLWTSTTKECRLFFVGSWKAYFVSHPGFISICTGLSYELINTRNAVHVRIVGETQSCSTAVVTASTPQLV
jgi:hypothetical protein